MDEYFRFILCVIFGVLPSSFWLLYYLRKDIHPEPKAMILKIFLFGAIIAIPVFFIQVGLSNLFSTFQNNTFFVKYPLLFDIIKWFLIVSFIEEFFKYLVVKINVFTSSRLDEPVDIMIYMIVVALGFAALENILYLLSPAANVSLVATIQTTAILTIIRFLGATFLHTLCSSVLGYFLIFSAMECKNKFLFTLAGIVLATVLHGIYDFSIMTLFQPFNFLLPLAVVVILAVFMVASFDKVKKAKGICKI